MGASNFVCAMGSLDRWTRNVNTLYIYVKRVFAHSGFKQSNFDNDIALFTLASEVPKNHPTVQPISISHKNAAAGQQCQVKRFFFNIYGQFNFFHRYPVGERHPGKMGLSQTVLKLQIWLSIHALIVIKNKDTMGMF